MSVLKTVITIILVIVSIILSIVVLMQEGKQEGLGSLASTDTYWSKNKGRSKEGALKKFTTVLAVIFFILALLLNLKWLN